MLHLRTKTSCGQRCEAGTRSRRGGARTVGSMRSTRQRRRDLRTRRMHRVNSPGDRPQLREHRQPNTLWLGEGKGGASGSEARAGIATRPTLHARAWRSLPPIFTVHRERTRCCARSRTLLRHEWGRYDPRVRYLSIQRVLVMFTFLDH